MGAVPGPARLLPRPARPADAPPADGAARRQCGGRRRRSCAGGRTSPTVRYPGFGGMVSFVPAAGGRHGRTAARTGGRHRRGDPPVHPGRVARRRRVADRGPGGDDPPVGGRLAARGGPGARPPVGRHRGRRRPDRRPGARRSTGPDAAELDAAWPPRPRRSVSRRPSPGAGPGCRRSPTGVSSPCRWRMSVSLRNALTNRLRSPSGPMSCDLEAGMRRDERRSRPRGRSPPATSTRFSPPVAVRRVGGIRTVLTRRRLPASARRPTGSAG